MTKDPGGPDMLELFMTGRLQKEVPEHLDLIKRWLAYFSSTPEYVKLAAMYRLDQFVPDSLLAKVDIVAPVVNTVFAKNVTPPVEEEVAIVPAPAQKSPEDQAAADVSEKEDLDAMIKDKKIAVARDATLQDKKDAVKKFLLSQITPV